MINSNYVGIQIFKDIEDGWKNPTPEMIKNYVKPGSGRDKIFSL
ncbi:MAG: stage sporulation protein [Bacillales bacterium]|jgi:stage V sporulation protein R|nr:stage sporulation protein [Bacillales bacterium]